MNHFVSLIDVCTTAWNSLQSCRHGAGMSSLAEDRSLNPVLGSQNYHFTAHHRIGFSVGFANARS